jgi:hypothetical protein
MPSRTRRPCKDLQCPSIRAFHRHRLAPTNNMAQRPPRAGRVVTPAAWVRAWPWAAPVDRLRAWGAVRCPWVAVGPGVTPGLRAALGAIPKKMSRAAELPRPRRPRAAPRAGRGACRESSQWRSSPRARSSARRPRVLCVPRVVAPGAKPHRRTMRSTPWSLRATGPVNQPELGEPSVRPCENATQVTRWHCGRAWNESLFPGAYRGRSCWLSSRGSYRGTHRHGSGFSESGPVFRRA